LKYAKDIREGIKFAFSPELAELVLKGWTVAESLVELDLDLDVKDANETAAHLNLAEFKDLYRQFSGTSKGYAEKPTRGWHFILNAIAAALPPEEAAYVISAVRWTEHLTSHDANINVEVRKGPQAAEIIIKQFQIFRQKRQVLINKNRF